jgi:hypothetical protein
MTDIASVAPGSNEELNSSRFDPYSINICNDSDSDYLYPSYRRLTFISMDACDFCDKVETPGPYLFYISIETKNGWVTCSNDSCRKKGEAALDHYMKTCAYGKANIFKGKCIKVRRTSGEIEDNWKLSNSFVEPLIDDNGVERVCVVNASEEIEKWIDIKKIFEWNRGTRKST